MESKMRLKVNTSYLKSLLSPFPDSKLTLNQRGNMTSKQR